MGNFYGKYIKILVPKFLWEKIEENPELKKILANINWLFFDKAVQMTVAFFVGVWVIRYLGPEKYGILSYAIAFVGLFGFIAKLGMDEIAVREFVKKPEKKEEILGTLLLLRLAAGFVAFICSLVAIFFVKQGDTLIFWVTFIIALGFIFQVSDVIDFWFQSQIKSKYTAYVRSSVSILLGLIKILLILAKASLIVFAWIILLESMLILIGFIVVFLRNKERIFPLRSNFFIAKEILSDSWPLILAGVAVSIYMKIDQVMIGNMLDNKSLGIYSAAVSLSEMWYFFPAIIVVSVFPAILYAKKISRELYMERLQMLYDAMVWVAIVIAMLITFFSKNIITLLYGKEYIQSAAVLSIYVWAGIFVFMGVVSGKYWVAEKLTKISLYLTSFGAVTNVLLNLWLIPALGIIGAAIATLVSYFLAGTIFIILFSEARVIFKMQLKTLNIFRILKYFKE
jgi:PST family polysaccharide transporter